MLGPVMAYVRLACVRMRASVLLMVRRVVSIGRLLTARRAPINLQLHVTTPRTACQAHRTPHTNKRSSNHLHQNQLAMSRERGIYPY